MIKYLLFALLLIVVIGLAISGCTTVNKQTIVYVTIQDSQLDLEISPRLGLSNGNSKKDQKETP